jgi:hypothetical protein
MEFKASIELWRTCPHLRRLLLGDMLLPGIGGAIGLTALGPMRELVRTVGMR